MTDKQKRVSKREIKLLVDRANKTEKIYIEITSWELPYSILITKPNSKPEHKTVYSFTDIKDMILELPIWDELTLKT